MAADFSWRDVGLPPPDDDEVSALVVGPDVDDDAEPVEHLHAVGDDNFDVPDVPSKLESIRENLQSKVCNS